MGDQSDANVQATWPPRFSNEVVGWTGVVLLLLFLSMAGWFRSVFDSADLFDAGAEASQHAAAYVLFIVGLLLLHVGIWFSVIEARKPPASDAAGLLVVDPGGMLDKVVSSIEGRKVSTVAFALGFTLLVLAAAGSGLIDISVGDGAAPTTGGDG